MKYRSYLVNKFGRIHPNTKDILQWAKFDYGYPEIQEWAIKRYTNNFFIIQEVMQSKLIRGLVAKV